MSQPNYRRPGAVVWSIAKALEETPEGIAADVLAERFNCTRHSVRQTVSRLRKWHGMLIGSAKRNGQTIYTAGQPLTSDRADDQIIAALEAVKPQGIAFTTLMQSHPRAGLQKALFRLRKAGKIVSDRSGDNIMRYWLTTEDMQAHLATVKPSRVKLGRKLPVYALNGEQVTLADLAREAGCTWATMKQRLKRGATPAQAVAMGVPAPKVKRNSEPVQKRPVRDVLPDGPVTYAPDCKVTRAAAPVDRRFAVDRVEPYFSALTPGSYAPSDSAVARAYG